MANRHSYGLAVLMLLGCGLAMRAQTPAAYDDQTVFMEAAREKALIYRGSLAPEYHFRCNGIVYAERREFLSGSVMYNGCLYNDVMLNIDACAQLLCVKASVICATDTEYVEYACFGGAKFVNLGFGNRIADAPAGYCKLLYEGSVAFYKQIRKTLVTDNGYHNGEDIGYYDPDYSDRTETYFALEEKDYLVKEGRAIPIRSKRAFLKCFDKESAKSLRRFAFRSDSLSGDASLENYAVTLLGHYDGTEGR